MTSKPDPCTDDDEIVTWWGLVIEGYLATQDKLMGEIAQRFGLAPAPFDILIRLVRSPDHRMPMTRLAGEAALSSGGFTKVADRLLFDARARRDEAERRADRGLDTPLPPPSVADQRVVALARAHFGNRSEIRIRRSLSTRSASATFSKPVASTTSSPKPTAATIPSTSSRPPLRAC